MEPNDGEMRKKQRNKQWLYKHHMGRVNRKHVFEHAQNAQIKIHTAHAQILIRVFAQHWYILLCQKIL